MEEFTKFGFVSFEENDKQDLIKGNPQLHPHYHRYQGMGWVQALVENITLKEEARYALVFIGGENEYTAKDNFDKYCQMNKTSDYSTLDKLLTETQKQSWVEINSVDKFDGVSIQHCTDHPSI